MAGPLLTAYIDVRAKADSLRPDIEGPAGPRPRPSPVAGTRRRPPSARGCPSSTRAG